MLGFFAFAFISWLSARSLEGALKDLRALNRELDQRVEDRTKALREANRQLAEANERLRELDRLKSRFVSMVSHELRTPLSAVQGFAEMLLAEIYGPLSERQTNALERITSNTKRLLHLINDLLDQARIEAGQIALQPHPFSPDDLVEEVQSTMGMLASSEGLELTTEVATDVPDTLHGDEKRLHQILVNLINNAIKFTDEGGVDVRIYRPDGQLRGYWGMEVSDTGPGISEEDQERIFDPFQRVDNSSTREHLGVGLGLSIVKELVDLMGGRLALESEIGEGSTFTILLPLHQQGGTTDE
jgi:signal transduction histidine kinase